MVGYTISLFDIFERVTIINCDEEIQYVIHGVSRKSYILFEIEFSEDIVQDIWVGRGGVHLNIEVTDNNDFCSISR